MNGKRDVNKPKYQNLSNNFTPHKIIRMVFKFDLNSFLASNFTFIQLSFQNFEFIQLKLLHQLSLNTCR